MAGGHDVSDEPRDDHGRWTAGGGGGIQTEPTSVRDIFARIRRPDGGFTFQPKTRLEPKTGYAVSIFPSRSFAKNVTDITIKDLLSYMVHNIDLLKKNDHFMGAWHHPRSHKVFLDVSVVSSTEREARDLALRHDQKAYFDLARGHSVEVNPHATSGGVAD